MTAEIVKCWAFNKSGQRCMQSAGHDGLHAYVIEWPDEECFSPIVHQLPDRRPLPVADEDPGWHQDDGECLVCDHPMHKRMCPLDGCDCRAGIPK